MAWVVDTCILLDIRLRDEAFGVPSAHCLQARLPDGLVICPITYVELAPAFNGSAAQEEEFLQLVGVEYQDIHWEHRDTAAAHRLWAEVVRKKRSGQGGKRPAADVLIEGFAQRFQGIITRNSKHFSTVDIITP